MAALGGVRVGNARPLVFGDQPGANEDRAARPHAANFGWYDEGFTFYTIKALMHATSRSVKLEGSESRYITLGNQVLKYTFAADGAYVGWREQVYENDPVFKMTTISESIAEAHGEYV